MERGEYFNEVKRLREQGRSIRAIARELGTNKSRVERALKVLNSNPAGKPTQTSPTGRRPGGRIALRLPESAPGMAQLLAVGWLDFQPLRLL